MRTLDDLLNAVAFHPATEETAAKYDQIRTHFIELARNVSPLLPDSPDKTVAHRAIADAAQQCISAVARNEAPADWVNPHVARVLPHGDVAVADTAVAPGWTCHRCQRNFDAAISKVMCCPTDCPPGRPVCEQCANDLHPPDKPGGLVTSPVQ